MKMNLKYTIMKKIMLLILLCAGIFVSQAQEKNLQAQFNFIPFYSLGDGPYLETYLTVTGNSAIFKKNNNNLMQASIQVTMLFKQNDKLVDFRKFNLLSPEIQADSLVQPNFVDVQRISLPEGDYKVELKIRDNHTETKAFVIEANLDMKFDLTKTSLSGIQLVEKYSPTSQENILSKNGYDMVPYVSNFYPENVNELIFYTEIYNADKELGTKTPYLLRYFIESKETGKMMYQFTTFKKEEATGISVLLGKFNVAELPSGNYNLVIEVRNRDNELVTDKRCFFQRSNPEVAFAMNDLAAINVMNTFASPINDPDTLQEFIKCLYPISDVNERRFAENLLKKPEVEKMQQYFANFWTKRDKVFPEKEWQKYKKQVAMINRSYSTQVKRGYETDRGRVYLEYGAPNMIREEKHSPDIYPFEIWQYYQLDGQSNRKFLFYNPTIVGEDYQLLHSNAIGEIFTQNWEAIMATRTTEPVYFSENLGSDSDIKVDQNWGVHLRQIWDNP
jgi:GWxTD domain-containing protein